MKRERFFELLDHLPVSDLTQIQEAYWLSKRAHQLQERDGGIRYFEHPRDVAVILIKMGYRDRDTIIKALLHDAPEDTTMPTSLIVNLFGQKVWSSLLILSKSVPVFDPATGWIIGRHTKTKEEYSAAIFAAELLDRAVKCADRVHNLRTMKTSWPKPRQLKYARETVEFHIPLARMTDMRFVPMMEEIVLPTLAA